MYHLFLYLMNLRCFLINSIDGMCEGPRSSRPDNVLRWQKNSTGGLTKLMYFSFSKPFGVAVNVQVINE